MCNRRSSRLLVSLSSSLLVLCFAMLSAAQAAPLTRDEARAQKLAAKRFEGAAVSLPDSALTGGLRVCARDTPSGINGYWRVPGKIVDLVDAELLAYLRKSDLGSRLKFAPKLYVRQYAGFVQDGVRMIYINALLVEKGNPAAADAKKAFPASCASVSGSWGIQYDTRAKKFSGFSRN